MLRTYSRSVQLEPGTLLLPSPPKPIQSICSFSFVRFFFSAAPFRASQHTPAAGGERESWVCKQTGYGGLKEKEERKKRGGMTAAKNGLLGIRSRDSITGFLAFQHFLMRPEGCVYRSSPPRARRLRETGFGNRTPLSGLPPAEADSQIDI